MTIISPLQDPLLLVPRNEGACLWAPSVPFSTTPACTVNTSSFSCHLHTHGAFTLERSKSDVQTYKHLHGEYTKKATFYTDERKDESVTEKASESHGFTLEKSKTSAIFASSLNPIDLSIFDNRPVYSRAAPSPPVRTKLSPGTRRAEISQDIKVFTEQGKYLGVTSILDEVPVAPRRKLSPKPAEKQINNVQNNKEDLTDASTEDLIKF